MAISTRLEARLSAFNSVWNAARPALSSSIGRPLMEPEVSKSSRQAQRGSGLSINSLAPNGTWSNSLVMSPSRCTGPTPYKATATFARSKLRLQSQKFDAAERCESLIKPKGAGG